MTDPDGELRGGEKGMKLKDVFFYLGFFIGAVMGNILIQSILG